MREKATSIYIYILAVAALAALGGWLYAFGFSFSPGAAGAAAILALVSAVSLRFPVQFGRARVDVADVAMLTALVMLGPLWALVVGAPAVVSYRDNRLRMLFVAAGDSLKLLSAGFVFVAISTPLFAVSQAGAGVVAKVDASFVYGALAAGTVYYALDAGINCSLVRLKYGTPMRDTFAESLLPLVPSDLAAILTAVGASYAADVFGPAVALVLFCGMSGALISHTLIHERQEKVERLQAEVEDLSSAPVAFAYRVVESLGRKDGRTARLSAASAVYAADVARKLGLPAPEIAKLQTAALLQDAGLVSVPDEVLLTPPENLNSVGRLQLEEHTVHGEHLLSAAPGFEEAARWVRWHHEREDGTGYPDKLRGGWIPLEAKILAACSVYAARVLDGPSSPGLSPQEARRELVNLSGRSLDGAVVRTLLRLLDAEGGNYAAAADHRFASSVTASGVRPTGTSEGN